MSEPRVPRYPWSARPPLEVLQEEVPSPRRMLTLPLPLEVLEEEEEGASLRKNDAVHE